MNYKRLVMVSVTLLITLIVTSQEIKRFPRIKTLLMESQLAEIKMRIFVDEKNMAQFDKIYRNYINEVSDLNTKNQGPPLFDLKIDDLSDQQVEDIFIKQTDRAKRLLIIREKFFYEFKSILSPRDVIKMYKIEREVVRKVQQEIRKRLKNR